MEKSMEKPRRAVLVDYRGGASRHERTLSEAGYAVQRVDTLSAALGAVGPEGVEVLLLASGLPPGDRRRVEGEAKRRRRETRIILFHEGEAVRDVFATAVLADDAAPELLLSALA